MPLIITIASVRDKKNSRERSYLKAPSIVIMSALKSISKAIFNSLNFKLY